MGGPPCQMQSFLERALLRLMNAIHESNGFLTETELLKKLPVSRRTIVCWRNKGLLPFIRPPGGRRILYSWPDVSEALRRQQQNVPV
jgi:hypothetical protein